MHLSPKTTLPVRGLLLRARPYKEHSWIGLIFTRELGVIHALWKSSYFSAGRTLIGIHADLSETNELHDHINTLAFLSNVEVLTTFPTLLEHQNGALILTLFSILIERTQSVRETRQTIWDLALYLISSLSPATHSWQTALTYFGLIALETSGHSLEEFFSPQEPPPQEVALEVWEIDRLLALLTTNPKMIVEQEIDEKTFLKSIGFIGMKLEDDELMKFAKEGT